MSSQNEPVPDSLHEWALTKINQVQNLGSMARMAGDTLRHAQGGWLRQLIYLSHQMETTARELNYLLGVYALNEGLVRQTEIAEASGVTLTTVRNRATSDLASRLYAEARLLTPEQQHEFKAKEALKAKRAKKASP